MIKKNEIGLSINLKVYLNFYFKLELNYIKYK